MGMLLLLVVLGLPLLLVSGQPFWAWEAAAILILAGLHYSTRWVVPWMERDRRDERDRR